MCLGEGGGGYEYGRRIVVEGVNPRVSRFLACSGIGCGRKVGFGADTGL